MPDDSIIKKIKSVRNDYIHKFFISKFGTVVMLPYNQEESLKNAISPLIHRTGLQNAKFTLTQGQKMLDMAKTLKESGVSENDTIIMNIDEASIYTNAKEHELILKCILLSQEVIFIKTRLDAKIRELKHQIRLQVGSMFQDFDLIHLDEVLEDELTISTRFKGKGSIYVSIGKELFEALMYFVTKSKEAYFMVFRLFNGTHKKA